MFNSPKDIKAAVTKLSQMTDYQLFLLVNKLVNKIKIAENLDLAITFVHFLMWYESVKSGYSQNQMTGSNRDQENPYKLLKSRNTDLHSSVVAFNLQ